MDQKNPKNQPDPTTLDPPPIHKQKPQQHPITPNTTKTKQSLKISL